MEIEYTPMIFKALFAVGTLWLLFNGWWLWRNMREERAEAAAEWKPTEKEWREDLHRYAFGNMKLEEFMEKWRGFRLPKKDRPSSITVEFTKEVPIRFDMRAACEVLNATVNAAYVAEDNLDVQHVSNPGPPGYAGTQYILFNYKARLHLGVPTTMATWHAIKDSVIDRALKELGKPLSVLEEEVTINHTSRELYARLRAYKPVIPTTPDIKCGDRVKWAGYEWDVANVVNDHARIRRQLSTRGWASRYAPIRDLARVW